MRDWWKKNRAGYAVNTAFFGAVFLAAAYLTGYWLGVVDMAIMFFNLVGGGFLLVGFAVTGTSAIQWWRDNRAIRPYEIMFDLTILALLYSSGMWFSLVTYLFHAWISQTEKGAVTDMVSLVGNKLAQDVTTITKATEAIAEVTEDLASIIEEIDAFDVEPPTRRKQTLS